MSYYDDERELTQKEISRLKKMTVKQLQDELDRKLKEELQLSIKNLREVVADIVHKSAHDIVCSYLGFRKDSWDKWEFDSHHKSKAVAEEMGALALQQVQMVMPNFVKDLLDDKVLAIPKMKKAAQDRYKEVFYEKFHDQLELLIQKKATLRSTEILAQLSKTPFEEILPQEDQDELDEAIAEEAKKANKTQNEDEDEESDNA